VLSSEGLKLSIYCQFVTWEKSCKIYFKTGGNGISGFLCSFRFVVHISV
jgi:hypothetical protein